MADKITPTLEYLSAISYVKRELGLYLQIDPFAGPEFAFHKMYLSKPPRYEKGITYPENFRFWKLINREELPEVEQKLYNMMNNGVSSEALEQIECLMPIFDIDQSSKMLARLTTIVKRLLKLEPEKEASRGICIIPDPDSEEYTIYSKSTELAKAFLPPKSWFNDELQNLTPDDILTILPKSEQIIYMLTIGRALVGPHNTIHVKTGRLIEHTWRTAPVLTGMPGIGKSTLTLKLKEALETVGYRIAAFNSLNKQFGIADIITADLAFADDLNEKTFKDFIASSIVKQCITGASIRTEKKFLDEVVTKPNAAFLCNINDFNIGVTYGADDGVLDRLKILNCTMPTQFDDIKSRLNCLSKNSPDIHPVPHFEWLRQQMNCSMNSLMLYFARMCVDLFLEKMDSNSLNSTLNDHTIQLEIQLHKHYEKVIAMAFQLAYILRRKDNFNAALPDLKPSLLGTCIKRLNFLVSDDRAHWVREAIKSDWKFKSRPSYHPWTGIKLFDPISVDNAADAYQETYQSFADKEIEKCIKTIYGAIRLNQGYNVPANVAQTIQAWDGSKKQFNSLLEIAAKVRDTIAQEDLEVLTSDCNAKTDHIRLEGYDRQAWADARNRGENPNLLTSLKNPQ